MRPKRWTRLWVFAAPVMLMGLTACDNNDGGGVTDPIDDPQLSYVGTETCAFCHSERSLELARSGHPYKLNKVVNGVPPSYPFSQVTNPPPGVSWDDVSYVIGGFGWKARFIGLDGFIITAGGQNQYNLATGGWVDYHTDEQKPYDCGRCHTTGYRADGNQDDLPGLIGQWAEPGVGCEECHGRGSLHVDNPTQVSMTIDTRAEECGRCHNRGGMSDAIPASGGFIRHHEQFNELIAGGHKQLDCVTCHDPHTGVRYNDQEGAQAITVACEECHSRARQSLRDNALAAFKADFACEDCHMPPLAKSAVKFDTFVGDIRTHLAKINPGVNAEQFDGGFANHYVTLDFACLGCHTDEDRTWAASYVDDIHGAGFAANRVPASTYAPLGYSR